MGIVSMLPDLTCRRQLAAVRGWFWQGALTPFASRWAYQIGPPRTPTGHAALGHAAIERRRCRYGLVSAIWTMGPAARSCIGAGRFQLLGSRENCLMHLSALLVTSLRVLSSSLLFFCSFKFAFCIWFKLQQTNANVDTTSGPTLRLPRGKRWER
jgi:hypothetical protein